MRPMKRNSRAACRRGYRGQWWAGMGLALALMGGAHAACGLNPGGAGPSGTVYDAYNGALFQIAVPAGRTTFALPAYPTAGEILFASEALLPNLGTGRAQGQAAPLYDCAPGAIEEFRGGTALLPGHQNLYDSGVPGIGYRVYYYYISDSENVVAPVTYPNTYRRGALVFPFNGAQLGNNLKARIEFVATGDKISPGQLLPANIYGRAYISNTNGANISQPYRVYLATAITVTPPTCDIQNPAALTVKMPSVPAHLLVRGEGRGITATTLDVACSSPSEVSPTITVTASHPASGYPATLSNQETGSGAAQGVGVQVWLYDPAAGTYRNPTFGAAEQGIGNPMDSAPSNRWQFRVGGSFLPINATVTAGKVSATATLKFTYP